MDISYPLLFPKDTRFFLLVGCMKSGTSWLMDALDLHPDICSKGEMHALEILDSPKRLSPLTLESVMTHDYALRRWYAMENNGWTNPYRSGIERDLASKAFDEDYVRFHFERMMWAYLPADRPLPRVMGDKSPCHTPHTATKIDRFFGVYKPYVIHMVRDPRDVATSRWFHFLKLLENMPAAAQQLPTEPREALFDAPSHLERIVSEWETVNQALLRDAPGLFGDRYLMIRYEDLKLDFAGTMRSILERLAVDASAERILDIQQRSDASRMEHKPAMFRSGAIGDGLRKLSKGELRQISRIAPLARRFGYELERARSGVAVVQDREIGTSS